MCGINGFFWSKQISNVTKRIDSMNCSIQHRGPDAGGTFVNDKIALGHRRLSIIDTREISNQPMHSSSNQFHLVFNGEIYNFEEIKMELNYSFLTNSDTEVIIAAVEEKGVDWFLEKANGMFAIALYNSIDDSLLLIRDRLGIKPLYYFLDDNKIIFSSEIKGILSSGLIDAEFNDLAVDEYLGNRYIRAPYTFFNNISILKPGTYLHIKKDLKYIETTYWDLPDVFNVSENINEKALLKEFDKELTKAIKYRLISDVPVGTYLSGGVDSSIITAITSLNKSDKVNTYTIGFPSLNEFEYSRVIANKYNTDHHELKMDESNYFEKWEELIKFKDSPLGVPNEIPLAVMSTKLKEKITVVLSGEGADELLGGYGKIFRSPFDFKNHQSSLNFYDYFISKYEYVPRKMRDQLINTPKDYREKFDSQIKNDFLNNTNEENVFRFFHKYHVKGLLQRVDMTTMQTSVEARVPFLDHNLIEFAYKHIPYSYKLKWNDDEAEIKAETLHSEYYSEELDTPKYLLRKLSYKYLPKEIIERKKMGFPVPLTDWFENLEEIARDLLTDVTWLKKGVIEDLIKKSKLEARSGQILWMFVNIELFKKIYFQKNWKWEN